ncbi:hypothetical protein [Natronomonas marina]|uniref:hypothetical protein n=1 Tax=Natronomonas marina TaxID=2961939 RepID=UPI0020C9AA94|nr:hypothetical protein [Natronomonas marina]
MALLAGVAVYNVYIITRAYGSHRAAVYAVTPPIFYPSFILIHSTVLREAAVLFGLTTGARFFIAPSDRLTLPTNYLLAVSFLLLSALLRSENLPVIAILLGIALTLKYRGVITDSTARYLLVPIGSAAAVISYSRIKILLQSLATLRRKRARGRTEYLGHVFPETVPAAVAFSWVGAVYFLFTPFPWMVEEITGFVALFEAVGNVVYALFGIVGARTLWRRNLAVGVTLTMGVLLGAILYGLGTANVGTAIRHRQMILWALFILGGIGISETVQLKA